MLHYCFLESFGSNFLWFATGRMQCTPLTVSSMAPVFILYEFIRSSRKSSFSSCLNTIYSKQSNWITFYHSLARVKKTYMHDTGAGFSFMIKSNPTILGAMHRKETIEKRSGSKSLIMVDSFEKMNCFFFFWIHDEVALADMRISKLEQPGQIAEFPAIFIDKHIFNFLMLTWLTGQMKIVDWNTLFRAFFPEWLWTLELISDRCPNCFSIHRSHYLSTAAQR